MVCSSSKDAPREGQRSGGANVSHPGTPVPWAQAPQRCPRRRLKPPTSLCDESGALKGFLGIWWMFPQIQRVRTTNISLLSWHRFSPMLLPKTEHSLVRPLPIPHSQPLDLLSFFSPLCCPLVLVASALSKKKDQLQAGHVPWSCHLMCNEGLIGPGRRDERLTQFRVKEQWVCW